MGRSLLAVVLGCIVLLVIAPAALAASGSITGTVVEAKSKLPLSGVRVEARQGFFPGAFCISNPLQCEVVTTDASGKYTIKTSPGSYQVEFSAPGTDYVTQYYHAGGNVYSFGEAGAVLVNEGQTTSNINAELRHGGTISGTVEGPSHEPLVGARVLCGCGAGVVETNIRGEYEVSRLPAGRYEIEFYAPRGVNLAPQAYKEASSGEQATFVPVEFEQNSGGISAVLREGGAVLGRVTDAGTHEPIPHITVAPEYLNQFQACNSLCRTETNANGEYSVVGLPTGSYRLGFYPSLLFVPYVLPDGGPFYQYAYVPLRVTEGSTTSGVNLALVRREPVNTSQLALSGTPAVGRTLFCSNGSWTGAEPIAFGYEWLRDGNPISGAAQTTYIVQTLDRGHELACQVTATNRAGRATARSNVLKVPPPPTIQSVSQSNSRWREGNRLASYSRRRPPVGTTFKFVLNQQAVVSFAFTQQVGGRKVRAQCVAQTRVNRHRPGCKRTVTRGTLTFDGHAGLNEVAFQGRISRSKKLPLAAYMLRISAMDSAGQTSAPRSLSFTIIK